MAAPATASSGRSPNSARPPQAFTSTSALPVLPCLSQAPRNCPLPSREHKSVRLTSPYFFCVQKMKANAVAGSWNTRSNSGCAWWGGHLPQCFQVLPSPSGCFYHAFLWPPCLIWRVGRVGLASSSFTSLNWQGVSSLMCRGPPSLHWFFILPTLWLYHGQPSKLWFLFYESPTLGILRKTFAFPC